MYCPKCGSEIEKGEAYCPDCNTSVEELFGKECNARCFICDEPLRTGDKFCRGCGNADPMIVPLNPNADGDGTYCWKCDAEFIGGKCPDCGLCEDDFSDHLDTIATMSCLVCGDKIVVTDKYCHACGNENSFASSSKTKAVFCKHCGIEFENGECPICGEKQEDALKYDDFTVCPNCQEFIDEYAHFCPVCGKPVDKKSSGGKSSVNSSSGYAKAPSKKSAEYQALLDENVPAPNSILWFILGFVQVLVCCNPFGIGTILCANKAGKLANEGQMRAANRKNKAAIIWFISGFASTAIICAIYFMLAAF